MFRFHLIHKRTIPTFDYSDKEVTWIHGGKKETSLVTIFSFPLCLDYPIKENLHHVRLFGIVICKRIQFGQR